MDRNALRGEIVRNGMTQAQIAQAIGMSKKTFSLRMKAGVFRTDEAEKLILILRIKNPSEIFFDQKVTYEVTKMRNNHSFSAETHD